MVGVSDRSFMVYSLLRDPPAASISALRWKRGGRVKAAPAASGASEALTRPSTSRELAVRSGGRLRPTRRCATARTAVALCDSSVWTERSQTAQTKPPGGSREIQGRPAVSQEQGDREDPWVLTNRLAGDRTDEQIDVIADVEFFEQRVQQPSRPHETVRAFDE